MIWIGLVIGFGVGFVVAAWLAGHRLRMMRAQVNQAQREITTVGAYARELERQRAEGEWAEGFGSEFRVVDVTEDGSVVQRPNPMAGPRGPHLAPDGVSRARRAIDRPPAPPRPGKRPVSGGTRGPPPPPPAPSDADTGRS